MTSLTMSTSHTSVSPSTAQSNSQLVHPQVMTESNMAIYQEKVIHIEENLQVEQGAESVAPCCISD